MNSNKMQKLTNAEQERVDAEFEILQRNIFKYGYPDEHRTGDPCLRVKKITDHTVSWHIMVVFQK